MFVTRNVRLKYLAPAGEGNDLGGNADGQQSTNTGKTDNQPPTDTGAAGITAGAADANKGDPGQSRKPSDEEARLLKENMKKKEELRKAQEELVGLRKQFEGIDPEVVRQMIAQQKDAETKALEAKGDYERLKQRMAEEHSKEINALKLKTEEQQNEVKKLNAVINDLTVGTQFSQSQFIASELTLPPAKARVIYGDYFDVQDGKVVGYDKPRGAANRTALVDQYGSPIPFDAAMQKIIDADPEKDHLVKSKVRPGANSDSRRPSTSLPKGDENVTGVNKIAAGLKALRP